MGHLDNGCLRKRRIHPFSPCLTFISTPWALGFDSLRSMALIPLKVIYYNERNGNQHNCRWRTKALQDIAVKSLTLESPRRGFLPSIGEVASPLASSGGLITSLSPELSSLPFSPCSSSPWPPKLGIAGFPLAGADPVKDMGVHMYTQ
jgi:hypothetical protein